MEKSNVILLSTLLIVASLFSVSHSLTLFGLVIDRVIIRGVLYCSLNGDSSAPPVPNATVYFECAGSNATLAQAVTNPVGAFTIVLNAVQTLTIDPSDCEIIANLPTGTCFIYPPDGTVVASVNLVSITTRSLLTIANYAAGAFFSES